MSKPSRTITLFVAEDDPDDQLLIEEAFNECKIGNPYKLLHNGIELLEELKQLKREVVGQRRDMDGLVLLDLNMPKMDGREALEIMKADPILRRIPVIVLTTSRSEEDIIRAYELGVSGYIAKPVHYEGLVEIVLSLKRYWFDTVELPLLTH